MTTKYNFGHVTLIEHYYNIKLKSNFFEKTGALSKEYIQNSKSVLNGELIVLEDFVKDECRKRINFFLKQYVTPSLKEGIYNHVIEFNQIFTENSFFINNISINEIKVAIDIKFSYTINIKEELKKEFKIYNNRLIAFFDILGFSCILENSNLEVVYANYAKLIDDANSRIFQQNKKKPSPNFEKAQFLFDSIVLVSKPIEELKEVSNFIDGCSSLLENAFRQRLPLRGAITLGDFIDSQDKNIFLSSAFSELVREEKNQEWAGCIISKKAEQIVLNSINGINKRSELKNKKQDSLLFTYKVPLKNKKQRIYLCLNYFYFLSLEEIDLGLEYLKGDKIKYDNMILFHKHFKNLEPQQYKYGNSFIKIIKTRVGLRYKLVNKNGDELIPKNTLKIPTTILAENGLTLKIEIIIKGELN